MNGERKKLSPHMLQFKKLREQQQKARKYPSPPSDKNQQAQEAGTPSSSLPQQQDGTLESMRQRQSLFETGGDDSSLETNNTSGGPLAAAAGSDLKLVDKSNAPGPAAAATMMMEGKKDADGNVFYEVPLGTSVTTATTTESEDGLLTATPRRSNRHDPPAVSNDPPAFSPPASSSSPPADDAGERTPNIRILEGGGGGGAGGDPSTTASGKTDGGGCGINLSYWAMMGDKDYNNEDDTNNHSATASPLRALHEAMMQGQEDENNNKNEQEEEKEEEDQEEPFGHLRGIDMSEEFSMTLLETSLLSLTPERRSSHGSRSRGNVSRSSSTTSRNREGGGEMIAERNIHNDQHGNDAEQQVIHNDDPEPLSWTGVAPVNQQQDEAVPTSLEEAEGQQERFPVQILSHTPSSGSFSNISGRSTRSDENAALKRRVSQLETALVAASSTDSSSSRQQRQRQPPLVNPGTEEVGETTTATMIVGADPPPSASRTRITAATSDDYFNLLERNKTLVKEVRFADQTCVELSGEKLALEKEVQQLKEQMGRERQEHSKLVEHERHEKSTLLRDLQESTRKEARADATCESLRAQMKLVEASCQSLREHTDQQKADGAQEKERLKVSVGRLQHEKDAVQNDLEAATDANTDLESRISHLERTNRELSNSSENLQQQIKQAEEDLDRTLEQVDVLKAELEESNDAGKTSATLCSTLEDRISELEAAGEVRSKSLQDELDQARKLIDTLSKELNDSRDTCDGAEGRCTTLQKQLEDLQQTKHDESQKQMDSLVADIERLRGDLENSQKDNSELRNELDKATREAAELEQARAQQQRVQSELKASREDNDRLKVELKEAKAELATKDADPKSSNRLEELVTTQKQLESVKEELQQANDSSQRTISDLMSQLTKTKDTLLSVQQECGRSCPEVAGLVQIAVANMESQANALGDGLALSTDQMSARISKFEGTLRYVRESIVFEQESDSAKEERDISMLTGITGHLQYSPHASSSEGQLAPEAEEEQLIFATFDSGCDRSEDLEMMEEARHDATSEDPTNDDDAMASRSVSDVTGDSDSLSSIAGISHLFSEGVVVDMSVSRTDSRDQACAQDFDNTSPGSPINLLVHELKGRIQSLTVELNSAKVALEPVTNERDSLQSRVESILEEKLELETSRDAAIKREADIRMTLDDLRRKYDGSTAECQTLEDRILSLRTENEMVSVDRKSLEEELETITSTNKSISEQLVDLEQRCDTLTRERSEAIEEKTALRERADTLNRDVQEASDTQTALREECESLQKDLELVSGRQQSGLDQFLKDKEIIQQKLTELRAENERLVSEIQEKGSKLESALMLVEQLKKSASETADVHESVCREVEALKKDKKDLESNLEATESELEGLRQERTELLAASQQASEDAGQLAETNERLASMTELNKQHVDEIEKYKEALKAAEELEVCTEERLLQTQAELELLRVEQSSDEERYRDMAQKLEQSERDQRELVLRIAEREDELQNSASVREAAEADVSVCRDQIQSLGLELDKLRNAERVLEQTNADRDDESKAMQAELADAKALLLENESAAVDLRAEVESREDKCRRLREYCLKLTNKCTEWETYSAAQAKAVEKLRAAYEQQRSQLHELVILCQQQDQVYSAERAAWTSERSNLHAISSTLEGDLDEIAQELLNFNQP